MFVIQVIPLIRGTKLESLSYFSKQDYPVGTFLTVPIRGKKQPAIVTKTKPVNATKATLKAAAFSLRKLPVQKNTVTLPETIRQTAQKLSEQYPASVGAILYNLLPPDVRNGTHPYPDYEVKKATEETLPQILTARQDERFVVYHSLVRATFARHGSVKLVVPSAVDIDLLVQNLSQGIKNRLVVFSPLQTKKQREKAYRDLTDTSATKLIITTPSHAYLERSDLLTVIIEQGASGNYISRQRPYLDHREALKIETKLAGRALIIGDTVPRTEDEVKRREEKYLTYGEEIKRMAFTAPLNIIKQKDRSKPDQPFKLFSSQLLTSVERALEARGRVFFYAARRGLAPVVVCIDCGHIFRCPDSNTPYSLVRTVKNGEEERWFVSSTSGRRVRAADVCTECGSWRLRERGIGIQQVYDEWKEQMPDTAVTVLDSETAPTTKQAVKIAKEFFAKRSGILIGTQIALPFLSYGVDVSAVISLDAARSIPTWRADEYLFRLLLRLRECTAKEVLVQTRFEADNLLIHASRGAIERFYDDEIALRKMLNYPPFSTFVLLTWVGTKESIQKLEKPITETLVDQPVQYYNSPQTADGRIQRHGLIRLPAEDKTKYATLLKALKSLPPYVKIEINPERIV